MEQIKFWGNEVDRDKIEMEVNSFICKLGHNVEIKDVKYSYYNKDNSRCSAMVRYNDPFLDNIADKLKEVRKQIIAGNNNGKDKGMIIVNDKRIGNFVRMCMRDFSDAACMGYGISNEMSPGHWNIYNTDQENFDIWWKQIQENAHENNHKILIISTEDVKLFGMCERLIQLVKKEKPLIHRDEEFIFDGYVFIEINGFDWDQVVAYAEKHNPAEYKDMMSYYHLLNQ